MRGLLSTHPPLRGCSGTFTRKRSAPLAANLNWANLRGANLRMATLDGAALRSADLGETQCLTTRQVNAGAATPHPRRES